MDNHSSLSSSINITQSSNALYEATFDDELNTDDVAELTEIWINERNCPEILPYKKRLIEDLMELIEHQARTTLPDVRERLSDKEIEYAQSYQELLEKHYTKSFLGSLPQSQQDVNEKFNNLSSVSVPDDYSAVIIRGKENEGDIQLDSRGEITLSPTSIYMVRYSDVQLLLEEGRVELI
ncbi:hypothetical protein INT43_003733 [Umbelopsis isabellina]|uniref:DNA replication complex GINS protein SLD5 n=1 Tax=Mortierella isabellina TaxID=91625 RepID=A0A8H7UBY4_MORIS|nr:hypothetical protein INT43_003733 [Umbelopsis isabellina]